VRAAGLERSYCVIFFNQAGASECFWQSWVSFRVKVFKARATDINSWQALPSNSRNQTDKTDYMKPTTLNRIHETNELKAHNRITNQLTKITLYWHSRQVRNFTADSKNT
jgi:hypothetical protein